MSIEYITDVRQDGKTTYVLSANKKSLSVDYKEPYKSSYGDRIIQDSYTVNKVTVNNDMTVVSSNAHLAEIVLAVEVVKVIKEHIEEDK